MYFDGTKIHIGGMTFSSIEEMRKYALENNPSWFHETETKNQSTTVIQTSDRTVIINGDVVENPGELLIYVDGNVDKIETSSGDVFVNGNCMEAKTQSGNITTNDIGGDAKAQSGNITARSIAGNASTMSGTIISC